METGGEPWGLEPCCGSLLRWEEGLTPDSKQSTEEEEFPWPSSEKVNEGLVLVRKGCFPKAQQRGERHFLVFLKQQCIFSINWSAKPKTDFSHSFKAKSSCRLRLLWVSGHLLVAATYKREPLVKIRLRNDLSFALVNLFHA